MKDQNLAIVQGAYEAFAARDMKRIEEYFADDVEVSQSPEVPWGGNYRGIEGLYSFLLKLIESVESHVVTEHLFAAGDHVVLIGRTQGKVVGSGAAFDMPLVHLWTLRDRKIIRYESYIDTPAMLDVLRR
jgi:ketosteroid isomerase-like protein